MLCVLACMLVSKVLQIACLQVALSVQPLDGLIAFDTQEISFGAIAIGKPATMTVGLSNCGKSDTAFRVQSAPGVSITPSSGIIAAGASCNMSLRLVCHSPAPFRSVVQLEQRGGGGADLVVTAKPAQPEVIVHESVLDFGEVRIQQSATRVMNPVCSLVSACKMQLLRVCRHLGGWLRLRSDNGKRSAAHVVQAQSVSSANV